MAVEFINSNIALFGSDLEHKVKETAAACEKMWQTVPTGPALRVWRIEKFHVREWPLDMYGQFHSGDAYIVLLRDASSALNPKYDVYFWLGEECSIDEQGTAAYKTVELDTFLGALASPCQQHREVQNEESSEFQDLFNHITYLPGGVESGFHHVTQEELHSWKMIIHHVVAGKIPPDVRAVSIIDRGDRLYVYEGIDSRPGDRLQAAYLIDTIKKHRTLSNVIYDNSAYLKIVA